MIDFALSIALLPSYWKVGCTSINSDDLDEEYHVVSYAFWLVIFGFTVTFFVTKD